MGAQLNDLPDAAVVGAGTMGHALALVFALGGHHVRLTDESAPALARSRSLMNVALRTLVDYGEVDPTWTENRLEQVVRRTESLNEAVSGARLVVEAIAESPDAKRAFFQSVRELPSEDAILGSNTSGLDIFSLLPPGRLRERALIVHWYTPPYLIDLVDIVPGPNTDATVVEFARATIAALGKKPIVFRRFINGYIANRIQDAIALEVYRLLDEGVASAREIDDAVIHGLALRLPILGVLAKADFTGLDLMRQSLPNLTYQPPPQRGTCDVLDKLIGEGRMGVKSGRGFFEWSDRSPEQLFSERDRRMITMKKAFRVAKPLEGG